MLPIIHYTLRELKVALQKSWEWRIGYFLIGACILARGLGLFSNLELIALDVLLRNRPAEPQDDHVVIVLLETDTIQNNQNWSDEQIAQLLEAILAVDPVVVGLNVFRGDIAELSGRSRLINLFEEHDNLLSVEKILPPRAIPPMKGVADDVVEQQFGFNDIPIDADGRHRRVFIGAYLEDGNEDPKDNEFKFSFSFKIASRYLENQAFTLENYPTDPEIPSFLDPQTQRYIKIPILQPTFGGYLRNSDIAPLQTMLNFRAGRNTFEIIQAADLLEGDYNLNQLTDKAVIVGSNDSFFPRFVPVAAASSLAEANDEFSPILPRIGIVGAEFEAHAASQIINRVLDSRPLLQAIHPFQEYLLIVVSGLLGIIVSMTMRSTFKGLLLLITVFILIILVCYFLLIHFGLWLPVLPMSAILLLCGITYLSFSYQNQKIALDEARKLEIERRKAIERTFNFIHAGPLQTLAGLLRNVRDGKLDQDYLLVDLEDLNKEIRGIGERLRQEAIDDVYFIDTRRDLKIDLTHPIHEVFYEVYSICIQKDLPGFQSLKVRSVTFDSLAGREINLDIKRKLCGFLQEALENVGKHAMGTTRLIVSGKISEGYYCLCVDDNGPGIQSPHCGEGTRFCKRLEEVVKGKFVRVSKPTGGTVCQLTWPLSLS
jgi:CHASE2 domain-containing sensor protein